MQGFGFLWSRRPVEGHFSTTHSDRIYTYLYGKTVYIRIIRRIYTPAKIHIRCLRIRVRRKLIYTYAYIRHIYTYTVWANPTYVCACVVYLCMCICVCTRTCVCVQVRVCAHTWCVRAHVKGLKAPFILVSFLPKRGSVSQADCPPWGP